MANKGPRRKKKNGLTPKQDAFTQKLVEQIAATGETNGTQAAMEVYDVKDKQTAGQIAYENLKKPEIKKTLEQALSDNGGNLNQITKNITTIANSQAAKLSGDTILKANIEILKLTGHYPTNKTVKTTRTMRETINGITFEQARTELTQVSSEADEFLKDSA
jgi:hypothetical protein